MITKDWFECTVSWQQPGVAIALFESFDGCFLFNESGDYVTVLGSLLLPNHDPIAITDSCVNHRLAYNLEKEKLTLAH
jgi:hypothetical protein